MWNEIDEIEVIIEDCQIDIHDDDWNSENPRVMNCSADSILQKILDYNDSSMKWKERPILSRVPDNIRAKHEMEYEPKVIAIGPYHRSNGGQGKEMNPRLKPMEDKKVQFLINLCKRVAKYKGITKKEVLNNITKAVEKEECNARNIYSESSFEMNSEDFVQMLVLDGCFIMESMLIGWYEKRDRLRYFFQRRARALFQGIQNDSVMHDLFLFENQIPFFILETIFSECIDCSSKFSLIDLALNLIIKPRKRDIPPQKILPNEFLEEDNPCKIHHLLHLFHIFFVNKLNLSTFQENFPIYETKSNHLLAKLLKLILNFILESTFVIWDCAYPQAIRTLGFEYQVHMIPTATQLDAYGVKFQIKEMNESEHYYNVSFKDGIMKVPSINISDKNLMQLCNFIALEQSCPRYKKKITSFVLCMDHLIDTADDVVLLSKEGIIINDVGSMNEVAKLLNGICNGFAADITEDGDFKEMYQDINEYCKRPINEWRAKLKRDYFSSPWSVIALIAAFLVLCLTIVQTVCAFMEATKKESAP